MASRRFRGHFMEKRDAMLVGHEYLGTFVKNDNEHIVVKFSCPRLRHYTYMECHLEQNRRLSQKVGLTVYHIRSRLRQDYVTHDMETANERTRDTLFSTCGLAHAAEESRRVL